MLTPRDIQETGFSKAVFGGYDTDSVDDFLEIVADDYAKLYKDNAVLKSKIKVLVDKIEEYRQTEDSMRVTLLAAQKKSEDLLNEAKTKSSDILAGATAEAETKLADLGSRMEFENNRLIDAQEETKSFIKSARELISSYTAFLDDLEAKEFPEAVEEAEPAEETETVETSDAAEESPVGDEAVPEVEEAVEELADAAEITGEEVEQSVEEAVSFVEEAAETAEEAAEAVVEEAEAVVDAAESIAEETAETAVETVEAAFEPIESTADEIIGSVSEEIAEAAAEDAAEEAEDAPPFDLSDDEEDEEIKVYAPKAEHLENEDGIFEVVEEILPENEQFEDEAASEQDVEAPVPAAEPEPRPKKHFEYDLPLDDIRPEDIKDVLADDDEPEEPAEQDEAALYAATMRLFYEDDDTRTPRPKFDFDDLQFGSNYDPNK